MDVGERVINTCRYTVTTRITSALRWAAMGATLLFHNCEGQSHKSVSTDRTFEVKGQPKQIRTEVPLLTVRPNRFTHCSQPINLRYRNLH